MAADYTQARAARGGLYIMITQDQQLRVTVESDGRVEITVGDAPLSLLLESTGELSERVAVYVFEGGDVLIGQLTISRSGVEVIQAGQLRGAYVELAGGHEKARRWGRAGVGGGGARRAGRQTPRQRAAARAGTARRGHRRRRPAA